jgi:hypothetical protein
MDGGGTAGTGGTDTPTPPAPVNPGVVTVRRLNRTEYNNTVRDLLGTSLRPADRFQADTPGDGFDTVGAATNLSPAAVRDYEEAAHALVDDLFSDAARLATVVTCDVASEGEGCARSVMAGFTKRAFRRPVTSEEVEGLLAPFRLATELGAAPSLGLRHALAAVLLSERFLFRLELDPDPASATPRRLGDYELASRLSYALWSSMPDAELFARADAGTLGTDAELRQELDRMLADPRAAALGENFAGQWLHSRDLDAHEVDPRVFPEFSAALAGSMKREAALYFQEFLRSGRALTELLRAPFTVLDEPLANHYGLPVPANAEPGETWLFDTTNTTRRGLLTLGAVLTATSFSGRTSPVKRGEFVLRQLLCEAVPPPPPEVVGLPDQGDPAQSGLTLRQRLEQHRENPVCIGCHLEMDPIGFGLENYDAVGRHRTTDNGVPVDSAGELSDGRTFNGALELAHLLADDPRVGRCITKNFMVYALGRRLDQPDDSAWIAHVAGTTRDQGGSVDTLVRVLVSSEAFRARQAALPR